jgi:succinylarginine dihydrolase
MRVLEANFDGLIGPTHNYAGLSPGNVPSLANAGATSSPRAAALQGLEKMRVVRDLGIVQGVLPPLPRPDLRSLARLGFGTDPAQALERAARQAPDVLAACWSASSMWTANAATVSPTPDTADARLHLTPANLVSNLHRSLEPHLVTGVLRAIFADEREFVVHDPLPAQARFSDEGAANHVRLASSHGAPGVELFIHGFDPAHPDAPGARKFPARQSRAACEAIARLHGLDGARVIHARQSAAAIDAGVFHNDVISTGNQHLLLWHEQSFEDGPSVVAALDAALRAVDPQAGLISVMAPAWAFSLDDAVRSYVFNSQVVTTVDGTMALVAPHETRDHPRVRAWVDAVVADSANPLTRAVYMDVRESMRNGGGPACLRLRVPMTDAQLAAAHPGTYLSDALFDRLHAIVARAYPETIAPAQLRDHRLARACLDAQAEIAQALGLSSAFA